MFVMVILQAEIHSRLSRCLPCQFAMQIFLLLNGRTPLRM